MESLLIDEMDLAKRLGNTFYIPDDEELTRRRVRKAIRKSGVEPIIEYRIWHITSYDLPNLLKGIKCRSKSTKEKGRRITMSEARSPELSTLKAQALIEETLQKSID